MRKFIVATLFFLTTAAGAGTVPPKWKVIKDSKNLCQIAVPEDWKPGADNNGSAVFEDASVAIAVVTSQAGQTFRPISESMLKLLNIARDKVFENSAARVFYKDRTGRDATEPSALSVMVAGKGCTCSSRVVFLPTVPEETAKKIVLSVSPAE